MWIKITSWEGKQILVNLSCVTHMNRGKDYDDKSCTYLHMNGGDVLWTYTKLEDLENLLVHITVPVGGDGNEN